MNGTDTPSRGGRWARRGSKLVFLSAAVAGGLIGSTAAPSDAWFGFGDSSGEGSEPEPSYNAFGDNTAIEGIKSDDELEEEAKAAAKEVHSTVFGNDDRDPDPMPSAVAESNDDRDPDPMPSAVAESNDDPATTRSYVDIQEASHSVDVDSGSRSADLASSTEDINIQVAQVGFDIWDLVNVIDGGADTDDAPADPKPVAYDAFGNEATADDLEQLAKANAYLDEDDKKDLDTDAFQASADANRAVAEERAVEASLRPFTVRDESENEEITVWFDDDNEVRREQSIDLTTGDSIAVDNVGEKLRILFDYTDESISPRYYPDGSGTAVTFPEEGGRIETSHSTVTTFRNDQSQRQTVKYASDVTVYTETDQNGEVVERGSITSQDNVKVDTPFDLQLVDEYLGDPTSNPIVNYVDPDSGTDVTLWLDESGDPEQVKIVDDNGKLYGELLDDRIGSATHELASGSVIEWSDGREVHYLDEGGRLEVEGLVDTHYRPDGSHRKITKLSDGTMPYEAFDIDGTLTEKGIAFRGQYGDGPSYNAFDLDFVNAPSAQEASAQLTEQTPATSPVVSSPISTGAMSAPAFDAFGNPFGDDIAAAVAQDYEAELAASEANTEVVEERALEESLIPVTFPQPPGWMTQSRYYIDPTGDLRRVEQFNTFSRSLSTTEVVNNRATETLVEYPESEDDRFVYFPGGGINNSVQYFEDGSRTEVRDGIPTTVFADGTARQVKTHFAGTQTYKAFDTSGNLTDSGIVTSDLEGQPVYHSYKKN